MMAHVIFFDIFFEKESHLNAVESSKKAKCEPTGQSLS